MNVTNNGKFALLLLLKETSPAVLCSSKMWVHSINKDRETHDVIIFIGIAKLSYLLDYVVIFIGICCDIYWNVLYLLEYVVIFIGMCYIYWNM